MAGNWTTEDRHRPNWEGARTGDLTLEGGEGEASSTTDCEEAADRRGEDM